VLARCLESGHVFNAVLVPDVRVELDRGDGRLPYMEWIYLLRRPGSCVARKTFAQIRVREFC